MSKDLFDSPASRTRENLRGLLGEMGVAPMKDMVREALRRGLFEAEILDQFQARGAADFISKTLKAEMPSGIPFAMPIDGEENGGGLLWKMTDLYDYDNWCAVIRRQVAGVEADMAKVARFRNECLRRFGRAPAIPELLPVAESEAA
jgi:hypothetical protein